MPQYLAPGVYVKERPLGPPPIEGVSTSTAAFIGETERGPFTPTLVTSLREYEHYFGGAFAEGKYLPHAVRAYFENGGQRLYVARLLSRDGKTPGVTEFEGRHDERGMILNNEEQQRGLAALAQECFDEVSILHAPGVGNDKAGQPIQAALVRHCKEVGFRFAVLDCAPGLSDLNDPRLDPRSSLDSPDAAFYYPWLFATAPDRKAKMLLPPGGFVCGVYARNDLTRGVWKAPANLPLRGALALERPIDHAKQDVLNRRGVNGLRHLAGRGLRVWGARTLSSDPEWRYVPVRRTALFLEHSLKRGLQWAVFEPNDEPLWAKVRQSVVSFLRQLWRNGALTGAKPEEAFFVRADRTTMTEADISNGRLIMEIGMAPVRPAEFVVIRIMQKTREAD